MNHLKRQTQCKGQVEDEWTQHYWQGNLFLLVKTHRMSFASRALCPPNARFQTFRLQPNKANKHQTSDGWSETCISAQQTQSANVSWMNPCLTLLYNPSNTRNNLCPHPPPWQLTFLAPRSRVPRFSASPNALVSAALRREVFLRTLAVGKLRRQNALARLWWPVSVAILLRATVLVPQVTKAFAGRSARSHLHLHQGVINYDWKFHIQWSHKH